ncbi:pimeloyl-ACP methyl ester carboxylesterase [Streptomyces griseochromogenes]|uniref:Pimeloyl-ACP methyl ester carboxylesterase n=1 Tax=Streptomyces griseochromogenes TaxID=68214 RepID=A0A1B1B1W2_9ACTN|nr:alpha/beta hydrolase [Streptomyces griseochromogenes]ANP52816.1 protease [Streptomyces griseochromogenes]MBP2047436.1 pimeloyl-ACP methyl ester carboxylesterase [Streptomyces griseochromogenes]
MLVKLSTRPAVRRCAGTGALALALLGAGLPAAAADRPQPDLSRFYRQKAAWAACKGADTPKDLQCATVTVPIDYAHPGAGTLDLALARYRATGPSRGSVLLNFGGPGGAGVGEFTSGGKQFMDLTNGYDVVTFDPRGVGRSSPVSCGDGQGLTVATEGSPDIGRPQALLKRLRQDADRCARHSGPVLAHIGTVNAARDMDVIRQALGDKKLNYLGFSYGTRLGAVYAAQFPHNVGRMALDGVDTLTEPLSEQGLVGAEGQQTALDDFLDWCTTDVACPFGQDTRAAGDQVLQLVRSLDENPVPTDFGGAFSGQDLVGAIGQALYSNELWPSLERALASLIEDGDTRRVLSFSSGGDFAAPVRQGGQGQGRDHKNDHKKKQDGGLVDAQDVPADNLPAALMAINCADDPDRPTATRITKDLKDLRAAYDEASPVFGRFRLTQLLMCYGRPKGTDFIRDRVKNVPSARMLLVGTRGDPATPYRWTEETARRLGPAAVVLDNKGEGHTGYSSSKCVHRKIDDFLLYGSLPPSGSSCPADRDAWSSTANTSNW